MTEGSTNLQQIVNTNMSDFPVVLWLFEQAMKRNGREGYQAWQTIDKVALRQDIERKLQYKIVYGKDVRCIFSVQFSDPLIWGARDASDAIYLHRIVVHPDFKGQRQFDEVLTWAKQVAQQHHLSYIRMDTWADNSRIISYYQSFGFALVGTRTTDDNPELPSQNRNLNVALLEMKVGV